MKKSIFLIFMLLNTSLVSAQTINILGKELSLLTVLPGILAAILALFFMILFIKDSIGSFLKRKAEAKEIESKEVKEEIKTEERPKFSKEEKMQSILTRLKHLSPNIYTADPKKSLSDLDLLAKDFFEEKYSIHQEYSLSELEGLAGISKEEADISKEISFLKYSGQQVKSNDLGVINSRLYKLVKESCQKSKQGKNYFQKLGINKEKIIKILKSVNLPKFYLPNLSWAKISFPKFSLSSILKRQVIIRKIKKGIQLSRTNMHEAKKIYGKALIDYCNLPIGEAKFTD